MNQRRPRRRDLMPEVCPPAYAAWLAAMDAAAAAATARRAERRTVLLCHAAALLALVLIGTLAILHT